MFGVNFGWLPPFLQNHKNSNGEFSLTDDECSWMISLQYLGHLVGCIVFMSIVDRLGRNAAIILSAIIITLCWIGVTFTKKVTLHLLIRFFSGIFMGLHVPMISIYIGENSSANLRGVFGSSASLFINGGMLFGCAVTTYCSYETSSYIIVTVSLVNLLSGILLREPAHHLLAKGRTTEAENQFFWLRGKDELTQKEFEDIKSNMTTDKPKLSLSVVFNRYFLITCATSVLIYFTGYPAVAPLVSLILVPTKYISKNELAILFELFQLVGAIISPFIIDFFGRRTLWMVSAIFIAIIHFLTAALFYAREKGFEVPVNEWLIFGSITAYVVVFSAALFPLSIMARTELLSQRFRIVGSSATSLLNGLTAFIVGHSFFWIAVNFGIQANFVCYALFSLVIIVFCYFYLPETKGMSLTEIEKVLENPREQTTDS
ncbi:hypothetical protein V9T40_010780 [Parthenolecanium corni]|uniref:Major facilitator superfamily (MFS) profile domain-containing protein n=1 Tax=Parthenolecanium corni TaxID=536013 RepID=A0AAN9T5K9_9HEMI